MATSNPARLASSDVSWRPRTPTFRGIASSVPTAASPKEGCSAACWWVKASRCGATASTCVERECRSGSTRLSPMTTGTVRKAIFPAAGLGTRFLPVTKAQPKEMLPLVDKPTIQYGVEEAIASGIEQVIMVTGGGKRAIVDHFDRSLELEHYLELRGKSDLLHILAEVDELSNQLVITYVQQKEPRGLGHAVWTARLLV